MQGPTPPGSPHRSSSPGPKRRSRRILRWTARVVFILVLSVLGAAIIGVRTDQLRLQVMRTGSMEPALPTGSVVAVRPLPSDQLQAGDVLSFVPPNRGPDDVYVHRIVKVEKVPQGYKVWTKGDANPAEDDWSPTVVASGQVWVAVADVPHVGTFAGWLRQMVGNGPVLWAGVALIVAALLVLIWSPKPTAPPGTDGDQPDSDGPVPDPTVCDEVDAPTPPGGEPPQRASPDPAAAPQGRENG